LSSTKGRSTFVKNTNTMGAELYNDFLLPTLLFYRAMLFEMLPPWLKGLIWWMGDQTIMVGVYKGDTMAAFAVNIFIFVFGVIILPMFVNFVVGFVGTATALSVKAGYLAATYLFLLPALVWRGVSGLFRGLTNLIRSISSFFLRFPIETVCWMYTCFTFIGELPLLPLKVGRELFFLVLETPHLFRTLYGFFVHPSGLPLGSEQGPLAAGDGSSVAFGQLRAQQEVLAHVSASGALSRVPRLRPRGRVTNMVQAALEGPIGSAGKFFGGRWKPDLPAERRSPVMNALLAVSGSEMKLLGCGAVQSTGANPRDYLYVVVEGPQGDREVLLPSLSSRLSQYSFLRERTPELLRGLRSRAVDWFKQEELPLWLGDLVLPGAVARACLETASESAALSLLGKAGKETLLSSPC
jgi:hypothetical protein